MRGSIQLDEDPDFQRRSWKVQRAGWAAMALSVAASLAGVFGGGPVSRERAESPDKVWSVEYERFVRRAADTELRYLFAAGAVSDPIRLKLDKGYLGKMRLESAPWPKPRHSNWCSS